MALFKGLIRNCVVCGNEYRSPQSHARVLTCSLACGYKRRSMVNKVEPVELQCKHCGKTFTSAPSHAAKRIYCSRECMHEAPERRQARSRRMSGDRNPSWKGGVCVDAISAKGVPYKKQQPHLKVEEASRKYRARPEATPAWADIEKIKAIYALRHLISQGTGNEHHVDHIVPLKSALVCGLHVENNLQITTGLENRKKKNLTWPDMW